MSQSRSLLAPEQFPQLPPVGGVELASMAAGLKYSDRLDLFLASVSAESTVAGVFTKSQCPSAPVLWCQGILPGHQGRGLLVNAGNANAFTGEAGMAGASLSAAAAAEALQVDPESVFLASTGVIGEPLDAAAIAASISELSTGLTVADAGGWEAAADAIRTTDTFAKGASQSVSVSGQPAELVGIAKGSGMIAPDMATMLAFVFTDLVIEGQAAQQFLTTAVNESFNCITVDSDTSTSDTVLLFSTGAARNEPLTSPSDEGWEDVQSALNGVCLDLAHQIVRDGEGATKFVEVTVTGAVTDQSARLVALAIANSPLVKTALAASDANWGRIVMAVGKAGEPADRDRLAIWIGEEQCAEGGTVRDGYSEEAATAHLSGSEVLLRVDLGLGDGVATVWTCDLTHGYIEINAGYRS